MKKYYLLLALSAGGLLSCDKRIELNGGEPTLEVSVDPRSYKVGEDVVFNLSGKAGIISFYSGEVGHDYNYRDGRQVKVGKVNLSFKSAVTTGTQRDQLSVWVSSDFNGKYDAFSNVQQARWTDITSRATLAPNSAYISSGIIDITDLKPQDSTPVYIAFRCVTKPQLVFGETKAWYIQEFSVKTETSIGDIEVAGMSNAGLKIVDQQAGGQKARSAIEAARFKFQGSVITPDNDIQSENWGISKPISLADFKMNPDRPVGVKGNSDIQTDKFVYAYNKPGKYTVHFLAANKNIDFSREVIKTLEITVVP